MGDLRKGYVLLDINENVEDGYSISICNESSGHRIAGPKIGGGETLESYAVKAEEIIREVRSYAELDSEAEVVAKAIEKFGDFVGKDQPLARDLAYEYAEKIRNGEVK